MKQIFIIFMSMTFLFGVCSADKNLNIEDRKVKLSYSVGYQVGSDFLRQGKDINPEVLLQGIQDALVGNDPLMTKQDIRTTLIDLQKNVAAAQAKKMIDQAEQNLAAGKAFLAENGEKEGVITLPSGLQYKVLTDGTGPTPTTSDTVTVHYRGTFIDGTEFDSSHKRNKPATFPVNGVISGWTEALQLMKEGAEWQLFIPPGLAYRDKRSGSISPNSTLVFEVELISIKPAK
jgi:FKBP-type peptidyl-prolyl cis-trans isomerase FklB